jgi:hypothetical protein
LPQKPQGVLKGRILWYNYLIFNAFFMSEIPSPSPETPPPAPEAPPQASISFRKFIEEAIAALDEDPKLSHKEKRILKKVLEEVAKKHDLDKDIISRSTSEELVELRDLVASRVEMRSVDKGKVTETDVADIVEFLETILDAKAVSKEGTRTDILDDQESPQETVRRTAVKAKMDVVADEKSVEGVKDVADLRELSVKTLMALEEKHEGILLYAFTDFVEDSRRIDLARFETFYKTPVAGTKLTVNFRGNAAAEAHIGASELMPPSVRRITVWSGGSPDAARTSTRRVGLKGKNEKGIGFFDGEGYIPVFSSDVMVVGGLQKDATGNPLPADKNGIDQAFEQTYRKPDGSLDFEKYAKDMGEEDEKFLAPLRAKRAPMGKVYTPEELRALEESIDASGVRGRIVQAAMRLLESHRPGQHCWNWVEQVYNTAGAKRGAVAYRHKKYKQKTFDKSNPGAHENPREAKNLQPGDWIFVYNKNGIDTYDDHSVLFLRWKDKENMIAEVANCTGAGKAGSLRTMDLKKIPVTMIIKPKA